MADTILCNSQDTAARVVRHVPGAPVVVAPLGIDPPARASPRLGPMAFLCIGTIEPRKNHAMLLDVWAGTRGRIARTSGSSAGGAGETRRSFAGSTPIR